MKREFEFYIGTYSYIVVETVGECNSAFEQKKTPGSWNDDKVVSIVPGVDFDPYVYDVMLGYYVECESGLLNFDEN